MYKVVEISGIIGSYYVEGFEKNEFCYRDLKTVVNRIHEEDEFISICLTQKSVNRILESSNVRRNENSQEIVIPSDEKIRNSFQREYYKMDGETRKLISRIIREFCHE